MADILDKCKEYTAATEIINMGVYPYFHTVESGQDPEVIIEGKKMIMVGSNNYLGLTSHPKLKEAAIKAIEKYGVGCVGSRFLNGTLDLHVELENKLAKFLKREAVLTFSTGMQANLGVISALVGKNDIIVTDKYDHASIIDGCRLSFGEMKRFKHNDMEDLERILKIIPEDKGKLIVVDGVFSMEGDIAKLPDIVQIARKYNARIMVDDAHGVGVLGKHGRGTGEYFNLENEVDLQVGTFSKSFASVGGFVAGSKKLINYLKHNARALIFSASLPPSNVATVLAALDIIESEPERIIRLNEIADKMRKGFIERGFDIGTSETPIVPIVVGKDEMAFKMWKILFDRNIFTTPVVSPAVPNNRAMIRTSYIATQSDELLEKVLDGFERVAKELGIIK
ncbi:MAG: pyridoxal phosphate-dependent aminotransferase family protein [Elusimicrobiota bacterium]|jgi:8-amino-7-oxononanoate synthase|nr:pyridoxal phosphate-dependent aminotransferase family protein [Elusimicrobiota bacterium]